MIAVSLSFPLGVYYAQSAQSHEEPEWPPSPVRLIGALLAAAHSRCDEPGPERQLIERLCLAGQPTIVAPPSSPVDRHEEGSVAELRGASRWAPRNYFGAKGRAQAAVEKVGVAIGENAVTFAWPGLDLSTEDRERLQVLAADITFLGTSRSPVVATVHAEPEGDLIRNGAWLPAARGDDERSATQVRVPDARTVPAFDARHALFRSRRDKVESARLIPMPALGTLEPYVLRQKDGPTVTVSAPDFDPGWWGEMIVVPIDRENSEVIPRSAAAYLVARAMRVALLGAFDEPREPGEAPPILRARGADPHCAIVPLADVRHPHSKGRVLGIAIVLPSALRVPDLPEQRHRIEQGLGRLIRDTEGSPRRHLQIPGAGRVLLKPPSERDRWPMTLDRHLYAKPSRVWATATPVVHSRWPKEKNGGLAAEVQRDLEHVGLPAPERVEVLRAAAFPGAADAPVARKRVPPSWRSSMDGPVNHLRLTFDLPVGGPILVGKARHFGLGLFLPCSDPTTAPKADDDRL